MTYVMPDELVIMLEGLTTVTQHEDYHPEVFVLNHSLQCFQAACRESDNIDFILACLLHDIGKGCNILGHDEVGAELIRDYVSPKTEWLVRNHMKVWTFIDGEMRKLSKVKDLFEHPWFAELVHLGRIDKLGRKKRFLKFDRLQIEQAISKKALLHFKEKKDDEGRVG